MALTRHAYGWQRDLPDHRDLWYALSSPAVGLPSSMDLTPSMPPVYDQGNVGSCTGNSCAGALAYARNMQGLPSFTPSRLQLYYDARALEGTTGSDSGAQIRDVIKGAAVNGACDEVMWPYDPAAVTTAPSPTARALAANDRAIGYRRLGQDLTAIRSCLAGGDPIVFGFSVFESFESDAVARTGIMPMPAASESLLGGHAVLASGYDDSRKAILVRNSWSASWGIAGYFYMPYAYITNPDLASDLWTIRLITP